MMVPLAQFLGQVYAGHLHRHDTHPNSLRTNSAVQSEPDGHTVGAQPRINERVKMCFSFLYMYDNCCSVKWGSCQT